MNHDAVRSDGWDTLAWKGVNMDQTQSDLARPARLRGKWLAFFLYHHVVYHDKRIIQFQRHLVSFLLSSGSFIAAS